VSERVVAARLVGTFGLRGELKCLATRSGESTLVAGAEFALGAEPGAATVRLAEVRRHHGRMLVTLAGVTTETAARAMVGRELFVARELVELADDEYLDIDLVGLRIVDETGTELGVVSAVEHYPAQDCLVVGKRAGMIPLVRAFIRSIDTGSGTITVTLPPGLLDASAAIEA
jgi:16S rRNA processing protein RimM